MLLAGSLKHRFQILKPSLTPSTERDGGLDQSYEILLRVWGEFKPASENAIVIAIRGVNTEDTVTGIVRFRWIAVKSLGKAFTSGYSLGYKGMSDLNPLKSNYYLFKEEGSQVKGRLFRIIGMVRDEDYKEFIKIRVHEVEEQGTGYGNE